MAPGWLGGGGRRGRTAGGSHGSRRGSIRVHGPGDEHGFALDGPA